MLINADNEVLLAACDPILTMIAATNGNIAGATEISTGVYQIGSFGGSHFLPDWEHYPDLGESNAYGVCDAPEQVAERVKEVNNPGREFVITVTKIDRSTQPSQGGWRWHKWGPYIGDHAPTTEYLYDEPDIEFIYVYHIYEKV